MERWVCARRTVSGNPDRFDSVLVNDVREILQTGSGRSLAEPEGGGAILVDVHAAVAGADLHKTVRVDVGEVHRTSNRLRIPLSWRAAGVGPLFPSFEGALELQVLSGAMVEICLVGHYEPPLGPVGTLADLSVLAQVAQRGAQNLLDGLVGALVDRTYGDAPQPIRQAGALYVADVMSAEPLMFTEEMPLRAAAFLLVRAGISGAPVIGADRRVVGVLSAGDLLDKVAPEPMGLGRAASKAFRHYHSLTVGEACTRPARTTEVDTTVRAAAREMASHDVDRLVVMNGAAVAGIVTRSDALRALVRLDDDIEDGIVAVLGDKGHGGLEVQVANGIVHLDGVVEKRSDVDTVIVLSGQVDGVLSIDSDDLDWEVDDTPPAIMPMV